MTAQSLRIKHHERRASARYGEQKIQIPEQISNRSAATAALQEQLQQLRDEVAEEGAQLLDSWRPLIQRDSFIPSAENLAMYIALRHRDLRGLQLELTPLGLSSLGRCESRVLETLDAVLDALAAINGSPAQAASGRARRFFRGAELLDLNTAQVFGQGPNQRRERIMVTLDSTIGSDRVQGLVRSGMDVARINTAHGSADDWRAIAASVRAAADAAGRSCTVCLDLTGPRARTGKTSKHAERMSPGDHFHLIGDSDDTPRTGVWAECTMPELFDALEPGMTLWIDEGKIGAVAEECGQTHALLRVTHAPPKGARLRKDKGMNLPEVELKLDSLTAQDRVDLDVAVEIADIVGYSFVQRRADIELLQAELKSRGRPDMPMIAKIETRSAVERLPELIVQAASAQPLAIMIARGDLAVEIGFSRLAEIQEELLWLCEAAHVPVVWATQVLNTFIHKGSHARGEITDAAMAGRAECVMLNKGPFAEDAVRLLDDVFTRMEGHQSKKTSRLRALHAW